MKNTWKSFSRPCKKNNLEGLDYLEFKESLEALSKMQMDEETKYKSAYAVAASMGANVHKLIQTALHYVEVLKKEKESYEKTTLTKMQNRLKVKKEDVISIEQGIKEKQAQIQQLKKDIDAAQREMIEKVAEIQQESRKGNCCSKRI